MAFAFESKRLAAAIIAVALTSVLVWFGTGLNPRWPLMWFAPIPVLLFASRSSWWATASVSSLAWLLGFLNLWRFLHGSIGLPFQVMVPIYLLLVLGFTLSVLLFRALVLRGRYWSALLALPASWVGGEFLHNLLSPDGTGGSLSYTQLKFLPFLQLASITGPWGMSFLLLLFPAAIAIGWHLRRSEPKQALRVVGATFGILAVVLIFGTVRLALPMQKQQAAQVKVGLIASDEPANVDVAHEGVNTERLLSEYANEAEKLAAQGAQVIVIPEKLGVVVDPATTNADAIFQSLSDKTGITIVAGLVRVDPPVKYNEARVYTPHAALIRYDKHHMLPPFESNLKPGTTIAMLPEPHRNWGVEICKDMDFTPLSRTYGEAGAGLMLAPAWDFVQDRLWHGHIAIMRGVEDGFSIARAAKQGYLTVSDDRGRIVAEARSDSAPFATLLTEVPATHDNTVYLVLGDWFGWLSVIMLIRLLARSLLRPRA